MKTLNIGLIGAGRIGQVHADSLAHRIPQAKLTTVSDIVLAAAQQCAANFHIPQAVADYRTILDDPTIDAVVICSSTDTHARIIADAAAAGKHIFCEKPIALDLDTIDAALLAVDRHGVKLQIGFNRRFDANFKQVRDWVQAGKIGQPHLVHIISRDPAPPPLNYIKVSGGIFLDMTIHDFDMARYLIDSEIEEVYAVGKVLIDPAIGQAGDLDTAVITLKYANGAVGTIDNSRQAAYGYDQRVEVFGAAGNIVVGNTQPNNAVYSNAEMVMTNKPHYFFLEKYKESYVTEMRAFIEAIIDDKAPPVSGLDGRIPVVVGLAALRSTKENRPVKISEIEKG